LTNLDSFTEQCGEGITILFPDVVGRPKTLDLYNGGGDDRDVDAKELEHQFSDVETDDFHLHKEVHKEEDVKAGYISNDEEEIDYPR